MQRMKTAYMYCRIPGVPDSEIGERVAAFCLATVLLALTTEERWQQGHSVGFQLCVYVYGGPATGKGTFAKIAALTSTGEIRTFGSQRFDGAEGATWITESVLHHPICYRDELDQFMSHGATEDMKTYLGGEPIQLRKKFESSITIPPKPIIISSNSLKLNEDDEALLERILVLQIEANPLSTKEDRNRIFAAFYDWVEAGGREICQRVGIQLYRDFRQITVGPPQWTRSAVFDAAIAFVCERLGMNVQTVMSAAAAGKKTAIRQSLPWFAGLREYAHHELGGAGPYQEATASQVWSISSGDESQARKLRRWVEQLEEATKSGPLAVLGWEVALGPRAPSMSRRIIFRNPNPNESEGTLDY